MKFSCKVVEIAMGQWVAQHSSTDLADVRVTAATREAALTKLRDELRYRLEYCPCTGELYRDVEIEVMAGGL
jgi:hypothetical protein